MLTEQNKELRESALKGMESALQDARFKLKEK